MTIMYCGIGVPVDIRIYLTTVCPFLLYVEDRLISIKMISFIILSLVAGVLIKQYFIAPTGLS